MGTHIVAFVDERRDHLRGTLMVSIILHAVLFVLVVTYTMLHFHLGGSGQTWGASGATKIGSVPTLPGIPLPTPLLTTHSTVATQNPGVTPPEPQPREEPPPEAVEIPKFKDAVKPEKVERVNKRIQKPEPPPPDNAVQTGPGAPEMNYTQVVTSAGNGGVSMGENNAFGSRFGYYVMAMRNRVSQNWLMSTISPSIVSAPRVYLTFEILRDGTINNLHVTQSSGIPEIDRSALRAILASNPLPPLPADYSGGSVDVQFYFDFHRQ